MTPQRWPETERIGADIPRSRPAQEQGSKSPRDEHQKASDDAELEAIRQWRAKNPNAKGYVEMARDGLGRFFKRRS